MSKTVLVKTKEELKAAIKSKAETIIVEGDLARVIILSYKAKNVAKAVLALLAPLSAFVLNATTVFAPPVGLLARVVIPVAGLTGLEVSTILAVLFLGTILLLAVYKDYDVELSVDPPFGSPPAPPRITLKLKKKT
jgi:hypothetical protein